jgi:HSP20 family protein
MKKRRDFSWDTGWTMTLFSRLVQEVSGKAPTAPDWAGETREPSIDIFENRSDVIIEVEVPGLKREDLSIRIDENLVRIDGYKRSERDSECLRYLCLERQFGVFRRIVQIPGSVDTNSVRAVLREGILRISLPRVSERRRSMVEVPITEDPLSSPEGDQ